MGRERYLRQPVGQESLQNEEKIELRLEGIMGITMLSIKQQESQETQSVKL